MGDKLTDTLQERSGFARLLHAVALPEFGGLLCDYVSEAVRFRNFGTYYVADIAVPEPVLSVWHGEISDYRFRHNASERLSRTTVVQPLLEHFRGLPEGHIDIHREQPRPGGRQAAMYEQTGVIESMVVSSREGRSAQQSFFLRSRSDGLLTDQECAACTQILPIAHELIGLRHKIVGSELFQYQAGARVSSLRERGVARFDILSRREAEVGDCIVNGLSVSGTALQLGVRNSTVHTLRKRIYRKLGITSAVELASLIINE